MKKLILAVCATSCALSVFAQGTIVFNNRIPGQVVAWIYGPQLANPVEALTGNDASGTPVGTTVYTGSRLSGDTYTAQLWGGPNANSLAPATGFGTSTFRTGAAAGLWTTSTDAAIIAGVDVGQVAQLQVRAWDNKGGTLTTWDQAVAANAAIGRSGLFTTAALGGTDPLGSVVLTPNGVATSFNIHLVPEPTTLALAGLGAALLIFRRRK